jgi:hypothetical protein
MIGESVSFTLDDGETLIVLDKDVRQVYDSLWEVSDEPGAVSTAALMMSMSRVRPYARLPVGLTTPQSTVLRKAVTLLHAC